MARSSPEKARPGSSGSADEGGVDNREIERHATAPAEPTAQLRRLRVRDVAGRIYADVTLGVPPARAASESHRIADQVEAAIHQAAPNSDVVVHAEPSMTGADLLDEPVPRVCRRPLAGEAAPGGLGAVAAPLNEAPVDPIARGGGVHA